MDTSESDDNVVNTPTIKADKGKGVFVPENPNSVDLLFKKSETREIDDVTILALLNEYRYNHQSSSVSEYDFIRRNAGEPVDEDRMRARILELMNNFRRFVNEKGEIKNDVITQEELSGNFNPIVFDLSLSLWLKEKGGDNKWFLFDKSKLVKEDYMKILKFLEGIFVHENLKLSGNLNLWINDKDGDNKGFLFDKSKSVKEDYMTMLKFLKLYVSSHGGGFNLFKDFVSLHEFIERVCTENVSATMLKNRVLGLKQFYCNFVKRRGENPHISNPEVKEAFDILKLIFGRNNDNAVAVEGIEVEKGSEAYLIENYPELIENKGFLFDKSKSVKEDYMTILKFLKLYVSSHGGGFNPSKDFVSLHEFIEHDSGKKVSATMLKNRVLGLKQFYCNFVKQRGENPHISDPEVKKAFDILKLFFGSNNNNSVAVEGIEAEKGSEVYLIENYPELISLLMENFKLMTRAEIIGALGVMEASKLDKLEHNRKVLEHMKDKDRDEYYKEMEADMIKMQTVFLQQALSTIYLAD